MSFNHNNLNLKKKYLKYKNKYLNLKENNNWGGASASVISESMPSVVLEYNIGDVVEVIFSSKKCIGLIYKIEGEGVNEKIYVSLLPDVCRQPKKEKKKEFKNKLIVPRRLLSPATEIPEFQQAIESIPPPDLDFNKIGLIMAHGRILKNFCIVPEGLCIQLTSSAGQNLNLSDLIQSYDRDRFKRIDLRKELSEFYDSNYYEGSIIPDMLLDFRLTFPPSKEPPNDFSFTGIITGSIFSDDLIFEYQKGNPEGEKNCKDTSLTYHDEKFMEKDLIWNYKITLGSLLKKIKTVKDKNPELPSIYRLIACRGGDIASAQAEVNCVPVRLAYSGLRQESASQQENLQLFKYNLDQFNLFLDKNPNSIANFILRNPDIQIIDDTFNILYNTVKDYIINIIHNIEAENKISFNNLCTTLDLFEYKLSTTLATKIQDKIIQIITEKQSEDKLKSGLQKMFN